MTLQPYTPERLDQFTLRLLDVCTQLRSMARRARDERLDDFQLHDKKALEWLVKLEEWAHKAEADVELAAMRQRGSARAAEAGQRLDGPREG